MDTEERIKALEEEFHATREELKQILFEIRSFLMEAKSPIPNDLIKEFSDEMDSQKGVKSYGKGTEN